MGANWGRVNIRSKRKFSLANPVRAISLITALPMKPPSTLAKSRSAARRRAAKRGAKGTTLIMLGTGMPRPDPACFGPATAVVVDGRVFLFDAGAGVMRRMAAAGLSIRGPEAVF